MISESTADVERRREAMVKQILVSDPDPQYGESQHVILCDVHLANALKASPMGSGEYTVPADDDVDCEECAARA
jgi:hypothetical protein